MGSIVVGLGCSEDELTQATMSDPPALAMAIAGNQVSPDTVRLAVGQTGTATCRPVDANGAAVQRNCNWSTRDSAIAKVSGSGTQTGTITGAKTGATWIIASAQKHKDSVRVIVGTGDGGTSPTDPAPPPPDGTSPASTARGCPSSGYLRLVNVSTTAGLSSALAAAQPGDQIRLAAGTYTGALSLSRSGTSTNPLVICGMPGAAPVLKGGQFNSTASYLVLTGIVFEGASTVELVNNVYLHNAHHVTFTGNEIRGGHYHAGLSTDEVHHMVITYNYIHDNGHDTSHDHGIYFKTTSGNGNVISNNILARNAARGISLHDNSGAGVFDVLVAHNTVVGNGSTGILVNDGDRMTVVNNIAGWNGDKTGQRQIRVLAGNSNQVRNNLTWSPTSSRAGIENATSSPMSGNKVGNPLFAAEFGDLRLRSGSPAVNLGLPGYSLSTDYAGRARDGTPDAGAYEQ